MAPQIIRCEQNDPAWVQARLGLVTASVFHTILVPIGPRGGIPEGRKTLLYKLAAEKLTGVPVENYTNSYMENGKLGEDEARTYYAYLTNTEPERVGFVRNKDTGASPDALIGADGGIEIKRKIPHVMVEFLLNPKNEFVPQVQGNLMVCEREWWDLIVYGGPKLPPFVHREYRDEKYIVNLAREVTRFNDELAGVVEKIRRYGA